MTEYSISIINNEHDKKKTFSCGIESLDKYLKQQASQDVRRNINITYILSKSESNSVAGYYTLSSSSVSTKSLPEALSSKLPRYPTVPVTLLGRLAIDQNHQGRNLGELLLLDALTQSYNNSTQIGSWAVIVDAINQKAEEFYKKYEFIQFPDTPNRLFLPMSTIEKLIAII